jgi:hypothetical protein
MASDTPVAYRWRNLNELGPGRHGGWHYSESPEWANQWEHRTLPSYMQVQALGVTAELPPEEIVHGTGTAKA